LQGRNRGGIPLVWFEWVFKNKLSEILVIIVVFSCTPRYSGRDYSEVAIIVIIVLVRKTIQTKCLPFIKMLLAKVVSFAAAAAEFCRI
jgi:hypothetical protein